MKFTLARTHLYNVTSYTHYFFHCLTPVLFENLENNIFNYVLKVHQKFHILISEIAIRIAHLCFWVHHSLIEDQPVFLHSVF